MQLELVAPTESGGSHPRALAFPLSECGRSDAHALAAVALATEPVEPFPVRAFADISADRVLVKHALAFEDAIEETSERLGGAGISATVLSPVGTWSGAVGMADARRLLDVDDKFAIASVTKSLQAAQLMRLVEAGRLRLDAPADAYLPAGLDFDTNGATIRQLMGMRSGIPDYWPEIESSVATDRRRIWTTADLLALTPTRRTPAGTRHEYADTNYLLLEQVIEKITGRTVVETMRNGGVLDIDGIDGLFYQPDERPTEPRALPNAIGRAKWRKGGGHLPSIASTTAYHQFATDSLSLAHWWQALCSGKVVSRKSLTAMTTFVDGYGLGLTNDVTSPYAVSYGHPGSDVGFIAWAGCLPESGSVIVTLSNTGVEDITLPRSLVLAVESVTSGTPP